MKKHNYLTYCEVDLKALKFNLNNIVKFAAKNKFSLATRPPSKKKSKDIERVLAVIKADAYGHGMLKVAHILHKVGVAFFAVSDVKEAIELRSSGIKKPILIFESTLAESAKDILKYQLTPMVCTVALARALNEYAKRCNKRIDVHIKVDTGMRRLGVWHEEAFEFIKKIANYSHLNISGIFTHFPSADMDTAFTRKQVRCLHDLVLRLDEQGIIIPYIHAANSAGVTGYETDIFNLVRPGLILYGLYPHLKFKKDISLKPVLSVKSKVIFLKEIKKGQSISYGRTFFAKKDMNVAVVPIGYNDGYFRSFSNKAQVLINGARCPIVGRVTMDQIIVDVTHLDGVRLGASVVLLGRQKGEEISADELAAHAGTINYEIVCALGNRLPRIYKEE